MDRWKRIDPTVITKIDYREVVVKTFKTPDDTVEVRATFLSEETRCAGVIAITDDNQVVIARQFRPGPERVMDEIPGGGVEEGEDPEAAARRELLEETGYQPTEMEFLGEFSRDAYMNGRWFYYLATGCRKVAHQSLDPNEFVGISLVSIETLISNAKQDRMTDVAAVLAAYDRLKELEGNTL